MKFPNADEFLAQLKENKIIAGIKLDDKRVLVAATEMNTAEEIDKYVSLVSC